MKRLKSLKIMLKNYERPFIYSYWNYKNSMNITKFKYSCFEPIIKNKIYKVTC